LPTELIISQICLFYVADSFPTKCMPFIAYAITNTYTRGNQPILSYSTSKFVYV
jgi:hypothetical protein